MKKLLVMILLGGMSMGMANAQVTLSLEQAIEIALSDNPTIKVADLEIERYDYVYKQTTASLYPQLSVSGQYSYAAVQQKMTKGGGSLSSRSNLNATASLSIPLFAPSVYEQMKLTKTQMAMAVESARANRIEMVASVRAAYYNVLLAEQSMSVLQEAIATTQRVVENTKELYENGLAAEYDYITAQVQLSNLKPQVLQAQKGIDLTKLQLKMYLSIPEETEINVIGSLDDFRNMVLLDTDYEVDLSQNTTIVNLELQSELLEHQEKLIKTTLMPTVAAFGQISAVCMEQIDFSKLMSGMAGGGAGGNTNPDGSGETGGDASSIMRSAAAAATTTTKSPNFWWQAPITVGAQISIPIFSGFSKTNQIKAIRNQRAQLDIQREYAERGVKLQVQQAINSLLTARETMLSNELTVEQAQKAYDIAYARYSAGAGTILELNSSQLTLTQAQLNYSQSIYDYLSAHASYEKALGVEGVTSAE
ncbi:MAG: TolC family protein [Alistipes sp.]|nr:TolC family protein [Alistipes sp.]MBO7306432.1 TolC family protein [Alistipes sp.]